MIVVSDTSPLTHLAAIGQFGLLRQLYIGLHIPEGVWEELNAEGKRWPGRAGMRLRRRTGFIVIQRKISHWSRRCGAIWVRVRQKALR